MSTGLGDILNLSPMIILSLILIPYAMVLMGAPPSGLVRGSMPGGAGDIIHIEEDSTNMKVKLKLLLWIPIRSVAFW